MGVMCATLSTGFRLDFSNKKPPKMGVGIFKKLICPKERHILESLK